MVVALSRNSQEKWDPSLCRWLAETLGLRHMSKKTQRPASFRNCLGPLCVDITVLLFAVVSARCLSVEACTSVETDARREAVLQCGRCALCAAGLLSVRSDVSARVSSSWAMSRWMGFLCCVSRRHFAITLAIGGLARRSGRFIRPVCPLIRCALPRLLDEAESKSHVLLVCNTNTALDAVLLKLRFECQYTDFARVGRLSETHPDLLPHAIASTRDRSMAVEDWKRVLIPLLSKPHGAPSPEKPPQFHVPRSFNKAAGTPAARGCNSGEDTAPTDQKIPEEEEEGRAEPLEQMAARLLREIDRGTFPPTMVVKPQHSAGCLTHFCNSCVVLACLYTGLVPVHGTHAVCSESREDDTEKHRVFLLHPTVPPLLRALTHM